MDLGEHGCMLEIGYFEQLPEGTVPIKQTRVISMPDDVLGERLRIWVSV